MKESFKHAGYKYIKYLGKKEHLLLNKVNEKLEIFFSNKNHSSWGLVWKNTHLEFASTLGNKKNI